jgi:hypothetical protein
MLLLGMNSAPLGKLCPICFSETLRRSKLRSGDVRLLLTLRYPVRCKNCGERSHNFIWKAFALRHAKVTSREVNSPR